jgi:hypothetical protein
MDLPELTAPRPVDMLDPPSLKAQLPLNWVCAQLGIHLNETDRGLCPFHDDDRPSFRIFFNARDIEKWHCYPCNTGGDAFDLIMRVHQVDFAEALRLARDYLNDLPTTYEPHNTVRTMKEGPDSWADDVIRGQDLAREPANHGFLATSTGLCRRGDPRAPNVDSALRAKYGWGASARQGGGVMMPFWNEQGDLVGCKVRRTDGSRTSLPGSKFECWYGAWRPKVFDVAFVTEGETDMAWADVFGEPTIAAVDLYALPGSSMPVHPQMMFTLARYHEVVLAYDGDDAGRDATQRWERALAELRIPTTVVNLPEGEDVRSMQLTIPQLLRHAF